MVWAGLRPGCSIGRGAVGVVAKMSLVEGMCWVGHPVGSRTQPRRRPIIQIGPPFTGRRPVPLVRPNDDIGKTIAVDIPRRRYRIAKIRIRHVGRVGGPRWCRQQRIDHDRVLCVAVVVPDTQATRRDVEARHRMLSRLRTRPTTADPTYSSLYAPQVNRIATTRRDPSTAHVAEFVEDDVGRVAEVKLAALVLGRGESC